jgi:hypothetical protein
MPHGYLNNLSRRGKAAIRREMTRGVPLILMLLVHVGMLAHSAKSHAPTWDEPQRLSAGVYHWRYGQFEADIGNPPLVALAGGLPVTLCGADVDATGRHFADVNGRRVFHLVYIARLACIPFSIVGAVICWRWACSLYGPLAGLAAGLLWCFCPLVLGHGALVTGDVAASSFGACACYSCRQWLACPTGRRATAAGVLLGIALLSKYVWVVMPVLWLVLWGLWRWRERNALSRADWLRDLRHVSLIAAIALGVVNLGFGFSESFRPLREYCGGRLAMDDDWERLTGTMAQEGFAAVRIPLPKSFLDGLCAVAEFRGLRIRNYFNGEYRQGTWWYFYGVGLAIKTPVAVLILIGASIVDRFIRRMDESELRDDICLVIPAAVVLAFVTWSTSMQCVRYVMPALPFLFVWMCRLLSPGQSHVSATRLCATCALLVWFMASSLRVYPHSLSYINEVAGGPDEGHSCLISADFDWGQDLLYLKQWIKAHPEAEPLHVVYHGTVDPSLAGIEYVSIDTQHGPLPGWYAISVTELHGRNNRECPYFLEHFTPVAKAGYSIFIYHITCVDANGARQKMGLPLLDCDKAVALEEATGTASRVVR